MHPYLAIGNRPLATHQKTATTTGGGARVGRLEARGPDAPKGPPRRDDESSAGRAKRTEDAARPSWAERVGTDLGLEPMSASALTSTNRCLNLTPNG
jgi:hypothetical protein